MSILSLVDVRYRWQSDQKDVINIDRLLINRGEHAFLMGPSGSGKSTLLNIVGGVIQPQHGAVKLADHDLSKVPGAQRDRIRADCVGFIFQQFNLIPYLNLTQNVSLPCQFSAVRRINAEKQYGSVEHAAQTLLGRVFNSDLPDFNKQVSALSVGQQQRVAAARALMGTPPLVIADEPTSALDHTAKKSFMELLLSEANRHNSTLLFVSHDPTLSTHFHTSIQLRDINQVGSP